MSKTPGTNKKEFSVLGAHSSKRDYTKSYSVLDWDWKQAEGGTFLIFLFGIAIVFCVLVIVFLIF